MATNDAKAIDDELQHFVNRLEDMEDGNDLIEYVGKICAENARLRDVVATLAGMDLNNLDAPEIVALAGRFGVDVEEVYYDGNIVNVWDTLQAIARKVMRDGISQTTR